MLVQRIVLAAPASGGLLLEPLPASGEPVSCQMDYVKGIHDLGGAREDLVDSAGVAGEPVNGHDLHLLPEARGAFLQPRAQHVRAAAWADIQ